MADMQTLWQMAQAQENNTSPFATVLDTGLKAFQSGYEKGPAMEATRLETAKKMLELRNMQIAQAAQAAILGLQMRDDAFSGLPTAGQPTPGKTMADKISFPEGKLAEMFKGSTAKLTPTGLTIEAQDPFTQLAKQAGIDKTKAETENLKTNAGSAAKSKEEERYSKAKDQAQKMLDNNIETLSWPVEKYNAELKRLTEENYNEMKRVTARKPNPVAAPKDDTSKRPVKKFKIISVK